MWKSNQVTGTSRDTPLRLGKCVSRNSREENAIHSLDNNNSNILVKRSETPPGVTAFTPAHTGGGGKSRIISRQFEKCEFRV